MRNIQTFVSVLLFLISCTVGGQDCFGQVDIAKKPHSTSEDGFCLDQTGKLLLRIPEGEMDDGSRNKNRSLIAKRIMKRNFEGLEKLYLMSDDSQIVASAVVSERGKCCLLYTSPSPRDRTRSRMPSSA